MILPKDLQFTAVMFSRMGNGGHEQCYRNELFGINVRKLKVDRNHQWETTFTVDCMPGQEFKTGSEVVEAFKSIPNPLKKE